MIYASFVDAYIFYFGGMERERITISIKKELLKKIDQQIDGVKMRNRSHTIEMLATEALGMAKIESAVIMAGGKGAVRLIPIIEDSLRKLKKYGLSEITIAIGFLGDKIKQSIGNGEKYGLSISYIEGGEGTAGALNPLKSQVKKCFIVVNLDQILDVNLKSLFDFHIVHTPLISVASNNLKTLKGYYIIEPEIFSYIPSGFSMLEEDIFPKLAKENKLLFFPATGSD